MFFGAHLMKIVQGFAGRLCNSKLIELVWPIRTELIDLQMFNRCFAYIFNHYLQYMCSSVMNIYLFCVIHSRQRDSYQELYL